MGETSVETVYEVAFKHALLNAYRHQGRAELKAVVSKVAAELPAVRSRLRELMPVIERAVGEVNRLSLEEQRRILEERFPEALVERKEAKEGAPELPPLPSVIEGRVVTRFAPNPDFVLHIGNSRVAILSHEYARRYKGKMILRFEDTDPRTKKPMIEAYRLIKEDLRWLGITWDEEYMQSLRLPVYYEYARKLIEVGGAYVEVATERRRRMPEEAAEGFVPPLTRDAGPSVNLELFDKMLEGFFGEGEAVVRIKTELNLPDRSLVDWVALRIIDTDRYPHPIVGSKYDVWPTYNFAVAVDDHLMGITHIIRGKEHISNTYKQKYVYEHLGWRMPEVIHVGRLKLEGFIMSKSYIKRLLEERPSAYTGPDDPRFGTLAALRRRGIAPETIRRVMISLGVKPSDVSLSYANLAAENRKLLDPISPRISFVWKPVELMVSGLGGCVNAKVPYHPDISSMGYRTYDVCDNDRVAIVWDDYEARKGTLIRLMELANFVVKNGVLELHSFSLEEARKAGVPIVHWVKVSEAVNAVVYKPVDESLEVVRGLVEKALLEKSKEAQVFQLLRFGFVRLESLEPLPTFVFAHE